MTVHETDVCIIGGGITSAMLAERLSELKPGVRITVVEPIFCQGEAADVRVRSNVT